MTLRLPASEIIVYADQFAEMALQVHALTLDDEDVVSLAYFGDGSVEITVPGKDIGPILVRKDSSCRDREDDACPMGNGSACSAPWCSCEAKPPVPAPSDEAIHGDSRDSEVAVGSCSTCGKGWTLRGDGTIRSHRPPGSRDRCKGSFRPPRSGPLDGRQPMTDRETASVQGEDACEAIMQAVAAEFGACSNVTADRIIAAIDLPALLAEARAEGEAATLREAVEFVRYASEDLADALERRFNPEPPC